MKAGASVSVQDERGQSPLLAAVRFGEINQVNFFLRNGASCSDVDDDGNSALHLVTRAYGDRGAIARRLLEEDPGLISACNHRGHIALTDAFADDRIMLNMEVVKVLLEFKADISFRDNYEHTSLHNYIACRNPEVKIVVFLLDAGSDIMSVDAEGLIALDQGGTP